jgi:hypothetical protein
MSVRFSACFISDTAEQNSIKSGIVYLYEMSDKFHFGQCRSNITLS